MSQESEFEQLRQRIKELEQVLEGSPEMAIRFGLKRQLNSIFKILLERDHISKSSLITLMAIHGTNKDDYSHAAHAVLMWRLRRALAPHGIRVLTRSGFGYYIPAEDKEKVKRIMADERP